jgi:hypothetical protein
LFWDPKVIVFIVISVGLSSLMIWGWVRWVKDKQHRTLFSIFSLIGLAFASASCLLSDSTGIYAMFHSFPYYDPTLMAIYRWGMSLSLAGIGFGVAGAFSKGPLRRFAPMVAGVMLVYWFLQAAGE